MYRLRTADKGKPLIISDAVISEYSDGNVDTLHKKNLLSLGEDRYLTTLMTKHFPSMSYKFVPSALALTAAPETWSILLSQRRRWINSTIHNLAELVFLKDMCGFCCFSMRFVVFIDLFGTLILPATCGYLAFLIYRVATHTGQFPLISIIMLAAVYGLQAVIFLIKRQWQHIGWMIIYILAFPIYSFVLPVYSFWKQDDFSWGNTRVVVGEKGAKQVVAVDDEGFDPRSIPLQRWDDYAAINNLGGRRGLQGAEKSEGSYHDYDMDDARSQYSSIRAATILTGFPNQGNMHMAPQSPAPYAMMPGMQQRHSTYSVLSAKNGAGSSHERLMSVGGMSDHMNNTNPYASQRPSMGFTQSPDHLMGSPNHQHSYSGSASNLLGATYSNPSNPRLRSPLGGAIGGMSRPVSTVNFMDGPKTGPSDQDIQMAIRECLREVDLDNVTKKQLRALAEQRLQTQLVGERKAYLDQMIDIELADM
jgi:chitin synthase